MCTTPTDGKGGDKKKPVVLAKTININFNQIGGFTMSKLGEKEKLEAAKATAKDKVGDKVVKTVDTITFKKNSGSAIIFTVLQKAKKPLTLKELTDRAVKAGAKESRIKTVANWFANNNIAVKADGKYELKPSDAVVEEEAQAA